MDKGRGGKESPASATIDKGQRTTVFKARHYRKGGKVAGILLPQDVWLELLRWPLSLTELRIALLVAFRQWQYSRDHGVAQVASDEDLVAHLVVSERWVRAARARLEAKGILYVHRGIGRGNVNAYQINPPEEWKKGEVPLPPFQVPLDASRAERGKSSARKGEVSIRVSNPRARVSIQSVDIEDSVSTPMTPRGDGPSGRGGSPPRERQKASSSAKRSVQVSADHAREEHARTGQFPPTSHKGEQPLAASQPAPPAGSPAAGATRKPGQHRQASAKQILKRASRAGIVRHNGTTYRVPDSLRGQLIELQGDPPQIVWPEAAPAIKVA